MVEIVAEFTTNALGNLNLLRRMVDEAKRAGVDSIKMQKKSVDTFYTTEKLNGRFDSPYGKTYGDYRRMFEFERPTDWYSLQYWCGDVPWFCTVQDIQSLRFMLQFYLSRYKIASSNARNWAFLSDAAKLIPHECEIVMSVGGSSLKEIEQAVNVFRQHAKLYLLHCVAEYPCPESKLRLGNIGVLKEEFETERIRIGYSGHEIGIAASVQAMNMGAEMIERHFCISRHSFAHHIECSLEPDEMYRLCQLRDADFTERMRWCAGLDQRGTECWFGMDEVERDFLEHQTYGTKYLGHGSEMR